MMATVLLARGQKWCPDCRGTGNPGSLARSVPVATGPGTVYWRCERCGGGGILTAWWKRLWWRLSR